MRKMEVMRVPEYPRVPGSHKQVDESEWCQDNPFGRCPACGSAAIEDLSIPGDPEINFYCSDTMCRDPRGRRTMWGTLKTPELLQLESQRGSWNEQNFPGQDMPVCCPD
jgi:hypothetical protein